MLLLMSEFKFSFGSWTLSSTCARVTSAWAQFVVHCLKSLYAALWLVCMQVIETVSRSSNREVNKYKKVKWTDYEGLRLASYVR